MIRARLKTDKYDAVCITDGISKMNERSGMKDGTYTVKITHDTVVRTIAFHLNLLGLEKLGDEWNRLVSTCIDCKHQHDKLTDASGHIKSNAIGILLSLIVYEGRLLFGGSQGGSFVEFDKPRAQKALVQCCG